MTVPNDCLFCVIENPMFADTPMVFIIEAKHFDPEDPQLGPTLTPDVLDLPTCVIGDYGNSIFATKKLPQNVIETEMANLGYRPSNPFRQFIRDTLQCEYYAASTYGTPLHRLTSKPIASRIVKTIFERLIQD